MPKLTRYVLAELCKVFLVVLIGLTLLMVLVGVVREAVSQSLGLVQIAKLIPFVLPDALRFAVPGTALFAACSVYGRMESSNEVVAIKSAGISPLRIMTPAYVAAFLLSLTTVWLNDVAVSWGRSGVQRVVIEGVEEIAYGMLRVQHSYTTKQFSINVKRVKGRRLIGVTITFQPTSDTPLVTITAEEAELRSDLTKETLTISCFNGSVDVGGDVHWDFPGWEPWEIPLADAASGKRESTASPSYRPLRAIPGDITQQRDKVERSERQLAVTAALALTTGNLAALGAKEWKVQERKLSEQRSRLYRLQTEPHRRWANGFSCLCFAMIGAPLAMRLRNSDFLTSFFLSFTPILLIYYPLLAYGVDRAKAGAAPPYIVWLANLVLVVAGVWLLRRVWRH